jgi:DNA transformation protein
MYRNGRMGVSDEYLTYVLEQLEDVGSVEARRMFGGAGIYYRGVMFALVADDVLYLKADDSNRDDFERAGMGAFCPFPDKATVMSYYEAPADVLESKERLGRWAEKALRVAERQKKK